RKLFKFIVAEVAVSDTGSQDQVVVGETHLIAVGIADDDALLLLVHTCDLSKDHRRVLLVPQDSADRGTNLARCEHRRRHLVKQGLKQMMVTPINQDDLSGSVMQGFGCRQTAESPAHDDDLWL